MRLIHLTRDVRGVVWSRLKAYRKDPEERLRQGTRSRSRLEISLLGSDEPDRFPPFVSAYPECLSMLLRYEDYTAEPIREFARISEVTGLDYGPIAERPSPADPVRPQHTCAGNSGPDEESNPPRLPTTSGWRTCPSR